MITIDLDLSEFNKITLFFSLDFDAHFRELIQFIKEKFVDRKYNPDKKRWEIPFLKSNLKRIVSNISYFNNPEILEKLEAYDTNYFFIAQQESGEIKLRFHYIGDTHPDHKTFNSLINSIKGWKSSVVDRWDGENRCWVVSLDTWDLLRFDIIPILEDYGERFKLLSGDDIATLKEQAKERKAKYYDPDEQQFNELINIIKLTYPFLRDYQARDTAQYCITSRILNGNQMGLGKTIETGAFISFKNPKKVLIIVPNSIKRQWNRELKKFFDLNSVVIEGTIKKRAKLWGALNRKTCIIITNYENLRTKDYKTFQLDRINFDLVVFDEITRCKNYDTQTHKLCKAINGKKIVGLTGTPIENHLTDIYSIMQIIHPDFFGDFQTFAAKYLRKIKFFVKRIGRVITVWKDKIGAGEDLAQELKEFHGWIRWNRKSVLKELPELMMNYLTIDFTPAERKIYNQIKNEIMIIEDKNGHEIKYKNVLSKIQALRRFCSEPAIYCKREFGKNGKKSAKKSEFVQLIKDNINGTKILAFSQQKDVVYSYAKALRDNKIDCLTITGDDNLNEREIKIEKLGQMDKYKVLLCTDAMSHGVNLQFCSMLINIDLHFNPAIIKQRIGRIHRIGQKDDKINIVSFIMKDSIEDYVYQKVIQKNALFDTVISSNEQIMNFAREYLKADKKQEISEKEFNQLQLELAEEDD